MKSKNQYITGDPEYLKKLYNEYKDYCGREVRLENGRLTVFALPPAKKRKKDDEQVSRSRRSSDDDTPTRSVGRREQRPKRD